MASKDSYNIVSMVDKVCVVLDYMVSSGGEVGISHISNYTGFSKSTVYRILYTMQERGLVYQNEFNDKYVLGNFFVKAGELVKAHTNVQSIALPIMHNIASKTGETINLGIIYQNHIITMENVRGESSFAVSQLEPASPLYCSSIGKLFLASFTPSQLKEYFSSNTMEAKTIYTITTLSQMEDEIRTIRTRGYSIDREEYEYGLMCLGCPLYNMEGTLIAGLSLSGPSGRIDLKGEDNIMYVLMEGAKKINSILGYEG